MLREDVTKANIIDRDLGIIERQLQSLDNSLISVIVAIAEADQKDYIHPDKDTSEAIRKVLREGMIRERNRLEEKLKAL